mgnify:CR=1 FL=1
MVAIPICANKLISSSSNTIPPNSPETGMSNANALIIVDIQNDYFPGGALPLWQAEDTEARILDAIGRAQAAGDRVILVRHLAPAGSGLTSGGTWSSTASMVA